LPSSESDLSANNWAEVEVDDAAKSGLNSAIMREIEGQGHICPTKGIAHGLAVPSGREATPSMRKPLRLARRTLKEWEALM
jgi:hypothetical protein